ncbi:hypothetical protein SS50377_22629 [Spironucleus salmonicida]|uniref:Uncharacterized protein n=1 Tax=Spironucleus salmonicida TaxID=348837 RepID=V6LUC4_9EUKA|nr:hypothetical protein SS50377_22618 [Spironucleus salmonicida]KAH0575010.1 hypothetical protein SS50377_22629 [Spironucleus salmonicida]|eukprot:EST41892.1 Hypothetical protein SS50377_18195 [Spironucleus salmonicida]
MDYEADMLKTLQFLQKSRQDSALLQVIISSQKNLSSAISALQPHIKSHKEAYRVQKAVFCFNDISTQQLIVFHKDLDYFIRTSEAVLQKYRRQLASTEQAVRKALFRIETGVLIQQKLVARIAFLPCSVAVAVQGKFSVLDIRTQQLRKDLETLLQRRQFEHLQFTDQRVVVQLQAAARARDLVLLLTAGNYLAQVVSELNAVHVAWKDVSPYRRAEELARGDVAEQTQREAFPDESGRSADNEEEASLLE